MGKIEEVGSRALKVSRLPANIRGRDIVIGDLHGHKEALLRLLDQANFDQAADRIISTGDIVDRGPDSMGCLSLLQEPWFHAVAGNHEQSLLAMLRLARHSQHRNVDRRITIDGIRSISAARRMGDQWIPDMLAQSDDWSMIFGYIDIVDQLPHILVIEEGENSRVNVVHAELLAAGLKSDAMIDATESLSAELFDRLTWSRSLCDEMLAMGHCEPAEDHQELSLTICGHNVVTTPTVWKQHLFIDTGCGFKGEQWMGLSGISLMSTEHFFVATGSS